MSSIREIAPLSDTGEASGPFLSVLHDVFHEVGHDDPVQIDGVGVLKFISLQDVIGCLAKNMMIGAKRYQHEGVLPGVVYMVAVDFRVPANQTRL